MNKKRKYIPGWQLKQKSEDRITRERAAAALDKYYEQLRILDQIEAAEELLKKVAKAKTEQDIEDNTQQTETVDQPSTETQLSVAKKQPAVERYGNYTTESALSYLDRTSDPTAFSDQRIRTPLDPDYFEWMARQTIRASRNPQLTRDPATIAAKAAVNLQLSLDNRDAALEENVPQRMQRRIREHTMFSTVDKTKALTAKELNEIVQFRAFNDPLWGAQYLEDQSKAIEENEKKEQAELNAVQRPDNYTGAQINTTGLTGGAATVNIQSRLASLANSLWGKSFMSDFILKTNDSQMKTSIGLIQRSNEFLDLSAKTIQNVDWVEQLANNIRQLRRFDEEAGSAGIQSLSPEKRNLYAKLLEDNRQLRANLSESDWWKNANNLASWAPTKTGYIAGIIDKVVDDDIGGVRNGLYGLDDKLDNLKLLLLQNNQDEKWLENITSVTGKIKSQLNDFNADNAEKQNRWRELALTDLQDIVDWRSGNNWMGMRAEVDPYYKALETLLEKSGFKWNDPVKMALFGWSGVAGGSNSSWWKSIISMASKGVGAIGGAVTSGGTSALIQGSMILTSFEADKSAGSDENNIEAEDRTGQLLRTKLQQSGKYDDFIKEGVEQLLNKKLIKSPKKRQHIAEDGTLVRQYSDDDTHYTNDVLKKAIKSAGDPETLQAQVLDMFLAGMWHSADPEITRMHADAVIGTNNQFYNNQPVNTADAAIGSIADIANLNAVKYLANSTKVVMRGLRMWLNRKLRDAGVKYQFNGFRPGIHNAGVKQVESRMKDMLQSGLAVAEKAPIGIVVGSTVGAGIGLNESNSASGAVTGAMFGAVAGAAGSYGLRKASKFIGVEDKIARAYQKTRAFATRIPSAWLKVGSIGKTTANITGRLAADTGSELMQEGVQALNARGDEKYDTQFNRGLALRFFDDAMLGSRAAYIWLNQNDPEMLGEADVWSQMNATPLLTLLGPKTFLVGVKIRNGIRDFEMVQAIANNIDAERRKNVAALEQGRSYAMYVTPEQKAAMHKKFDQYRKIASVHKDATEKLGDSLLDEDENYIPEELINEQEKDFEDIYELANSRLMESVAKRANAKRGTDKYAKLVSYTSFALKRRAEKLQALHEIDERNADILGEDALADVQNEYNQPIIFSEESFGEELPTGETISPEQQSKQRGLDIAFVSPSQSPVISAYNRAKMLILALTLFRIVDDYSALKEISGRDDVFLNRTKAKLNKVQDVLKQNGIEINNEDDVMRALNMSDEGVALSEILERSDRKNDRDVSLSTTDRVDAYADLLRDRELAEFDVALAEEQYRAFLENPEVMLYAWDRRRDADRYLEGILEEDYANAIRDIEHAATRRVRNGDIYLESHGSWYIVKEVNGGYRKYKYDWRKRKASNRALPFNAVEYDKYWNDHEKTLAEREKARKARENINTGTVKPEPAEESKKTTPPPALEPAPIEAPSPVVEPDPELKQAFTQGLYVQVTNPETGDNFSGIVRSMDTEGNTVEIETPNGEPIVVPNDANIVSVLNSPISTRKYASGTIITDKRGKKYTIASSKLTSIDETTMTGQYQYDVIDLDTDETILMSESDIDEMLKTAPVEESFEESEDQKKVGDLLRAKLQRDKSALGNRKPTAHDYFIKIKNRIQRFVRVHGILDPLFNESKLDEEQRTALENELRELFEEDKKKFTDRVNELQTEYNKLLEDKFGADSYEYKYYKINLREYLTSARLYDEENPAIIATIIHDMVTNPALIVGTHIDNIAREFFSNNGVVTNKPEYNMSEEVFASVIQLLEALKDRFNELKWTVYTDEFTWYGMMSNGTRFAGTTDMIAVDQQGGIHVLDFKTTSNATRFDAKYQYLEQIGNESRWITVPSIDQIPEGYKYRITSSFVTDTATKDYGQTEGNRSYAAQYARQLAAYRYLIQQELSTNVKSLEIIPFYVGYEVNKGKVTSIDEVYVYDPINLSDVEELRQELQDVDDYLNDTTVDRETLLEDYRQQINDLFDIFSSLTSSEHISEENKALVTRHTVLILDAHEAVKNAIESPTKRADSVYINQLFDNLNSALRDGRDIVESILQQISDAENEGGAGNGNGEGNGPEPGESGKGNRSWLFEPLETVVESAKMFWHQFNNLYSLSDYVTYMPNYMLSIIQRDFIKNSKFVITRDDKYDFDVFHVTITYRRMFTFKDITLRIGNDAVGEDRNKAMQADDSLYSLLGRNFLRQFYQLRQIMKPGDTIIATHVERTNGKLVYGNQLAQEALEYSLGLKENFLKYVEARNIPKDILEQLKRCSGVEEMVDILDKDVNLQDTVFFDKDDSRYGHMLDGTNSIIGVVDERGNVVEITTGTRQVLLSPATDLDGNLLHPKTRTNPVPGNDTDTIPSGTVMFLYKFKNEEDPEEAEDRIIPVALKGMKLGEKKNGGIEPSNPAKLIVALLKSMASGKSPNSEIELIATNKDGSKKKVKVPGLSHLRILNLITRFGQQSWYAGHEFIFDFARDNNDETRPLAYGHTVVTITDMRAEPKEVNGILHRDPINIDLGDPVGIQTLYEILAELELHINQFGEAKLKLNESTKDGPFGDLLGFFSNKENSDVQSIMITPEMTIDREDVEKGLSGIEWVVKHGLAKTNALSVTNPLISIHELDIDGRRPELPEDHPGNNIGTDGPEQGGGDPVNTGEGEDNNAPEEEGETGTGSKPKGGKPAPEVTEEDIRRARSRRRKRDYGTNLVLGEEELRQLHMTTEEKHRAERNIRRLLGRLNVNWTSHAIKLLQNGAAVAGRAAVTGLELYDRIPEGGEYHEIFHRIFEILIPNKIRESLYNEYRQKYGETFKNENGREITDVDISEAFAEMFRHFMIDREHIQFRDLSKTFGQIRDYINGLRSLGSRNFAMLFIAANSGIFRFKRPDKKNVEHFLNVLGGEANMTVSMRVGKNHEKKTLKLEEFPDIGGRDLLNDAVSAVIYALCTNYGIDYLARNASKLKTGLSHIQTLYKGEEETDHSSWFRVITGEYANEGDHMTVDDAFTYWDMYEFTEDMRNITERALKGMDPEDREDEIKVEDAILREIIRTEGSLTKDQLDPKQRMLGELFSEKAWPFVEKKVNNRLHKMGVDSELVSYEEYIARFEERDDDLEDDSNLIGNDAADHSDDFFDHSRTDDATAAIRFFLSSIPDEHFATQDDVDAGIVDYTTRPVTDDDGVEREEPVMVKNYSSLFGFKTFLSMKTVSQKLLSVCNNVRNAEQLDELLLDLAMDDPIFYRIAKKYHAAKLNEIVKHKSGKNKILIDGLNVDESDYFQHKDENGYYYTWANKDKTDSGNRIAGAVTQTNPDMESFVTQLFNYVACQRLDFIRVKFSQRLDEEGEPIDGEYISEVRKTSDDYSSTLYPRQWFERFRAGFSGIFRMTTGGRYTFTEDGKEKLDKAIRTIEKIYKIIRENKKIELNGVVYDKAKPDEFLKIENEYINALNDLGIDITREAFEYGLRERFGRKEPLSIQMAKFFGLAETNGVSYKKFSNPDKKNPGILQIIQKKATADGKNEILSLNRRANDATVGRFSKGEQASGSNLYSDNSVVKWFAKSVSAYNKSTKELMTNGPENTKRYLMAQSHTVSDITVDINDATCDTSLPRGERQIKGSRVLKDMLKYIYNYLKEGIDTVLPIGSLIIKLVVNHGDIHLTLHTHGGIMVDDDLSGGVSYKKITEREDWLAKAAILKQGGIIFPTLSDKSTWFYITGVRVPGINYSNIDSMSLSSLPDIGKHIGEDVTSGAVHVIFDWSKPNEQIDQMIEYAECEMRLIEREINRKSKLPIIEYFNENRKRFGAFTEIMKIDDKGLPKLVLFNDYDETPETCLERAKSEFFDLPIEEKRKRMALTLETGFWENIEVLEHAGVIVADGNLREAVLDENGNPIPNKTQLQHRLLQYSNVGLDTEVIKALTQKYLEGVDKTDKEAYAAAAKRAQAKAITAHVWDIYMRGVISNEEVERIYTGHPQFFKWVHGKIKDVLSGETINALIDRFSDQSKRLGGAGSTGERNRLDIVNARRTYVCAEIEDVKVKSALYDDFKRIVKISSVKNAYLDWKTQEIKNLHLDPKQEQSELYALNDRLYKTQKYDDSKSKEENEKIINDEIERLHKEMEEGGVGVAYDIAVRNAEDVADTLGMTKPADGAAFISPECAKTLLRMRGKFTSEVQKAFEYLEGDSKINPLRSADAYKVVVEALIGTQKYSAYGYRINAATDEIPVHYYNKFALFPLFKFMATGFTADLYRKMQEGDEQGRPIDMVMMHSGVKTGSEEARKFDPSTIKSQEDFDAFQFHTYEQDYSFIRRQLNTDPHEKETTTMGTQMTKVALSNIKPNNEYTLLDGTTIRGTQLLQNIMNAINALSNIGRDKVKAELCDENGNIDIDKFSEFLEQELDQRDADANLIDGVEVVIDPKTGKKTFNVELEAMSSVDWIQSIIVSKINKEVCDINVKGNAFYQRPAWGVEGKPLILDDETVDFAKRGINNGDALNVINNDGSMDAVISLDFFYDILPEGIRDDFEKSRAWLFKHKIIGNTPDVHACCINARIPTLAQSSIGALRFVDVLPVVRDTIILPSEITGIDGSDFK